jgi:hypothetical protein
MRNSLAMALILVVTAGMAHAAPTPAQKCSATKIKASGKNGNGNGVCASKASKAGLAVDPLCLAKADDKLDRTFAKAELKGGCLTSGDAGTIGGLLDGVTSFATAQLGDDGSADSRKCASARIKAAGKYVNAVLKCHAKAEKRGTSVDTECLDKAQDKLSDAFDKAETASHGNCDTAADSPATQVAMDAIVADVLAALLPLVPTTTTPTTSTTTTTFSGPVSLAANVQPLFDLYCISCHAGATPAQGMDLSTGSSYTALVNVPSNECLATLRVDPGSPTTSYLVHKLAGTGPCFLGSQMPLFALPLAAPQQQLIADWIAQGAADN